MEGIVFFCGENLSLVDDIKYQKFWRIDGFIGAILDASIPHIGQLVNYHRIAPKLFQPTNLIMF